MRRAKLLLTIGTRPEAIKLQPLADEILKNEDFELQILSTGQHSELIQKSFKASKIRYHFQLQLKKCVASLAGQAAEYLQLLEALFHDVHPDLVIVQGDTTSATMAGLAASYHQIPVAHIEAGLRTFRNDSPFPEEINRKLISTLSELHFCPTIGAKKNLMGEGIPNETIFVTGNTGIDALKNEWKVQEEKHKLIRKRKLILVTLHRREKLGSVLNHLLEGLRELADIEPEYSFLLPVHPNPAVRDSVMKILGEHKRIHITRPLNYSEMLFWLRRAACVFTDSGGLQEEAPTLGIHTLVLRSDTERAEALSTGFAHLVGIDPQGVIKKFIELKKNGDLEKPAYWRGGPFGDGDASARIVRIIQSWWKNQKGSHLIRAD